MFPQQQLWQPRTSCGECDKGVVYRFRLQGREIGVSPTHRMVKGSVSELNFEWDLLKSWYKELYIRGDREGREGEGRRVKVGGGEGEKGGRGRGGG